MPAAQPAAKEPACTYTVSWPSNGHNWITGMTGKIIWSTRGPACGGKVKLDYSPDGGKTWSGIISSTDNNGNYTWKVPGKPTTKALVKVTDLSSPTCTGQSEAFTISAPGPATAQPAPAAPAAPACTLSLKTPHGGERWKAGGTAKITWSKTGTGCGAKVKLEYSLDGGTVWAPILIETNNTGQYAWKVPNQPSSKAKVKVTDKSNPNMSSQSARNFTIAPLK
jgi:hypothetical protein